MHIVYEAVLNWSISREDTVHEHNVILCINNPTKETYIHKCTIKIMCMYYMHLSACTPYVYMHTQCMYPKSRINSLSSTLSGMSHYSTFVAVAVVLTAILQLKHNFVYSLYILRDAVSVAVKLCGDNQSK